MFPELVHAKTGKTSSFLGKETENVNHAAEKPMKSPITLLPCDVQVR